MSSGFQAEIEAYYKAKTPYTELLGQAMTREKPKGESVQKLEPDSTNPPAEDEDSRQMNSQEMLDLLNFDGLSFNYEAVAKAAATVKEREEKAAKDKGKAKGRR